MTHFNLVDNTVLSLEPSTSAIPLTMEINNLVGVAVTLEAFLGGEVLGLNSGRETDCLDKVCRGFFSSVQQYTDSALPFLWHNCFLSDPFQLIFYDLSWPSMLYSLN